MVCHHGYFHQHPDTCGYLYFLTKERMLPEKKKEAQWGRQKIKLSHLYTKLTFGLTTITAVSSFLLSAMLKS